MTVVACLSLTAELPRVLCGGLVMTAFLAAALSAAAEPVRLYVAPDGEDGWSGTLPAPNAAGDDGPFATLHRARDAVRELKADAAPQEPVVVELRGGTYYLDEPLVLGPDDSGAEGVPVIYRARPDERVVISGGRSIEGPWRTRDGRVYAADLPEALRGVYFRQLRVGDEMAQRCRHPKAREGFPDGPWLQAAAPGAGSALGLNFAMGLGQLQQQGTWLEYDIDVPADGRYELRVLYANNGDTNERFSGVRDMSSRTSVSVDDGPAVRVMDLTETGSFYEGFRWAHAATLQLAAGEHAFRWTNTEGGALSLLAFLLTDDPDYEPPVPGDDAVPEAHGHLIGRDAEDFDRKHGDLVSVHNMLDREDERLRTRLPFYPGDLEAPEHLADAEVYVIPEYDWVSEMLRVTDIDERAHVARVQGINATKPIFPHNRYCVFNVLDVLDRPGEWCLHTGEGRLYYQPESEDFGRREIVAPALDRLIELRGEEGAPVHHVRLEGLVFRDTRITAPERVEDVYHVNDGAVWMVRAERCRITDCTFDHVGGYAVWVHDASRDNVITGNEIVGAGEGGVYIDGYVRDSFRETMPPERRPRHNLVAGNHIHHCGTLYAHVSGVYVVACADNLVAHNHVHHMPRYGISLKDRCPGNVIEYNEVRFTNLLTRDTGAIEMAGNYDGSIVRFNVVTDAIGAGFLRNEARTASPADAGGIYLDNRSSNNTVVGNIVTRCWTGMWINWGGGNTVRNNILYNNRAHQALLNLPGDRFDSRGVNTLTHNIMVCDAPDTALYRVSRWEEDTGDLHADHNCIVPAGAAPEFVGVSLSGAAGWRRWQQSGQDVHSALVDPATGRDVLAAPDRDDFSLPDASPARALGFEPIDTGSIGLRGYHDDLIDAFLADEADATQEDDAP